MKLRNNYNIGDRILILHANTKNQLRKNDIGKIGTILDKRCSFCVVHLDGDDRDKNYNYGTFAKITKVYVSLIGSSVTLDEALNQEVTFNTIKEAFDYIRDTFKEYSNYEWSLNPAIYDKRIPAWRSHILCKLPEYNTPQCFGFMRIEINTELNNKFPEEKLQKS